jgi:hypothetical protein
MNKLNNCRLTDLFKNLFKNAMKHAMIMHIQLFKYFLLLVISKIKAKINLAIMVK